MFKINGVISLFLYAYRLLTCEIDFWYFIFDNQTVLHKKQRWRNKKDRYYYAEYMKNGCHAPNDMVRAVNDIDTRLVLS